MTRCPRSPQGLGQRGTSISRCSIWAGDARARSARLTRRSGLRSVPLPHLEEEGLCASPDRLLKPGAALVDGRGMQRTTGRPDTLPGMSAVTQVQRVEVDRVPVFWAPGPAPFTAGLVFGVGRRDEGFIGGGVTHVVEHLAMSVVGRTPLSCNASVDLTSTTFTASGDPERVAAFLWTVCEALTALPLDRLATEVDVLRTEGGFVAPPAVCALLGELYGARGVGLAGFREPALASLTPQDVQGWADSRFVRAAAALWLTGPPPEGLRLPLREGAVPAAPDAVPRALELPALVEATAVGLVALGAQTVQGTGAAAACRVLRDRLEDDLRHRRGLSYTVDTDSLPLGGDRQLAVIVADCRDGDEAVVARALWQALGRLAEDGPTPAELELEHERIEAHLQDPRAAGGEAQAAAVALVTGTGYRTSAQLREEADALTAGRVQQAARALRDAALVAVPEGVDPGLPALTPVAPWSAVMLTGREFRPRFRSPAPRGARLVVGDQGVSLWLQQGERLTVRWDDVIGLLEVADREWTIAAVDGTTVPIAAADWRDGDEVVALVQAAVRPDLQVTVDDLRSPGHRALLLAAPPHSATEALWTSGRSARVLHTDRWSLVLPDGELPQAYECAAALSAAAGRKHPVLLLEQVHDELSLSVWSRGSQRDAHRWGAGDGEPDVLAGLLDADVDDLRALLAHPGRPAEVLHTMTGVLGTPPELVQVLAGARDDEIPRLEQHAVRGVRESALAAARGDFDPPDSTALHHRITRWERRRPPAYRAVNGVAALGQAVGAAALATRADGDLTSWSAVLAGAFVLGAAGSLWSTRPPSPSR